ncbi:MAG: thioredoxin-disulfide reductase [Candidatus Tectomicrobia bacterium]|uniref:Thioredoxin reductase n=1 Tax=Tectimicrobiota bacterium TaxID=2528274 RepID=A0A932CLA8_UNCTE|nr:thioredoxin-disulfide reductase [Candidatus Tectomicrobia bacterium]
MYEVIILGAGPAGLTAAIYTSRAGLRTLAIPGMVPGGQLVTTTLVENYPGFPEGVMGPELMVSMHKQAENFGAEFVSGDATGVDLGSRPFRVMAEETTFWGKTLIVATGASPRLLGLEAEKRLMGRGVSTCATCDGFFFRNKDVIVVGGGDSAMEEALFLSRLVRRAEIVHRRDRLRASRIMQERALQNEKIGFIWNATVHDILDPEAGEVTGVLLKNVLTGEVWKKPCDGVFLAIGHTPNTQLFRGWLEMDENGYLITHQGTRTNIPGVFAAGDAQDHVYRQAVTAAGSGCMAALDVQRFLETEG